MAPHFVLLPFLAQGHLIPMVDVARLLAMRGVTVTILVTPQNGNRIKSDIDRAVESGLSIRVIHLKFPYAEAGLPEGCESTDLLPSPDHFANLFRAIDMLKGQVQELLPCLEPMPSCLMPDFNIAWPPNTSNIPTLVFHASGSFCNLLGPDQDYQAILASSDRDHHIGLPGEFPPHWAKFFKDTQESEKQAFRAVVNSFQDLDPDCVENYMKNRGKKLWCIGPVFLCNKDDPHRAERGNKASIDGHECLKWLDSQESSSVIYVCLGSESHLSTPQLLELGLGIEASNRPFIWVIRNNNASEDGLKTWLLEFEQRTRGRGLVIQGWAPQVLILPHPSVGGFITHCGWNSMLEGITAALPMITWPSHADHFLNEDIIVNVVKAGIRVGGEVPRVQVKSDHIKTAIDELMDGGEGGKERRERVRVLAEKTKGAVEEGGSSYNNITQLIQDVIMQQADH